ncbi:hypothetical protein GCM10027598_27020 [Amycolatopsis oliviviridis]|uniref:DUF7379 domain-containing protein n=1 Tax=Amycolatopsis oliviviridis TaxID=1471590 RepID=A0ABQ3LJ24_9PSEU|nr:alpha/beta fold hydrolase [Amycolatopsis oliviviridis]GHH17566.1 hypothetical protein GCM10017790_34670 [Amycolatopsis oliviviridis]
MAKSLALFVHGLFSTEATWNALRGLLATDAELTEDYDFDTFGYSTPKLRMNPARRVPDFNVLADRLASLLETKHADAPRVVLVAHSQGGLIVLRFLMRQLAEGNGVRLSRIRRIVLFACPNNGSEFMLTLRRSLLGWHAQERELRPLAESVVETQRRVLADVVYAPHLDEHRCPIPVVCYAGDTDNIVWASSAKSVFPAVGVLQGDHSSIIQPDGATHPTYLVVRDSLRTALTEPMPSPAKRKTGMASSESDDYHAEMTLHGPIMVDIGGASERPVAVAVRSGPVDQIAGVDIVCTSENIYMQMAMTFKPSVSGRLRRAAAKKGPAGEIIEDTAAAELDAWMRENGRFGLPVEPGTVAATSSGDLIRRDVHRIYHAAIGIPVPGTDRFEVSPVSVAQAVHNVFDLARRERDEDGLPLRSVLMPLFGAGLGGLDPAICFEWMWRALEQELRKDDAWEVHISTWTKAETEIILAGVQAHAHRADVAS